jgi:hypothetical protein
MKTICLTQITTILTDPHTSQSGADPEHQFTATGVDAFEVEV